MFIRRPVSETLKLFTFNVPSLASWVYLKIPSVVTEPEARTAELEMTASLVLVVVLVIPGAR